MRTQLDIEWLRRLLHSFGLEIVRALCLGAQGDAGREVTGGQGLADEGGLSVRLACSVPWATRKRRQNKGRSRNSLESQHNLEKEE